MAQIGHTSQQKERESQDLVAQTRTLEYDISKQLSRIDDLNNVIHQKDMEIKNKEAHLTECQSELLQLKN